MTDTAQHTPGPLTLRRTSSGGMILTRGEVQSTQIVPVADARLLAAAYTSYDRHCGARAVQCAEADLLGEALTVAGELLAWSRAQDQDELVDVRLGSAIIKARAVLAKAKGGAA